VRKRLREAPSPAELAELYSEPHQHTRWLDHVIRVNVTTAIAATLLKQGGTVADLSCGDAAIAQRLEKIHDATLILGDYAPGYEHTGPIEETITVVQPGTVDLWVCSETAEHVDDPDAVLAAIRKRASTLILSTPEGEEGTGNPEHIWSWLSEDVEKMLVDTGWTPVIYNLLDLRPAGFEYAYQIWVCR